MEINNLPVTKVYLVSYNPKYILYSLINNQIPLHTWKFSLHCQGSTLKTSNVCILRAWNLAEHYNKRYMTNTTASFGFQLPRSVDNIHCNVLHL